MPELPEIETIRVGLAPYVLGQTIAAVVVRQKRLRLPIMARIKSKLVGCRIESLSRRAKYLLIHLSHGTLVVHLGMSGNLFVLPTKTAHDQHCHFDVLLSNGMTLRFRDPRRFGAILWTAKDPLCLPQLAHLGLEPLGPELNADYLYTMANNRKVAVKNFLMNASIIVGVGNIYANESLFRARISPLRAAGRISRQRYQRLLRALRFVLRQAIRQGGSSVKDFTKADGQPGYFQLLLKVYDREGLPCRRCRRPITRCIIGGRSSFYCRSCQV